MAANDTDDPGPQAYRLPIPSSFPGWVRAADGVVNLALQRTPATGRAHSALDAHWSVSGSAELCC